MAYSQQWSCDVCTFKQSAHAMRCAMCNNPNPFQVGSGQSSSHFQVQKPPPKPKPVVKKELEYQSKPRKNGEYGKIIYQTDRITKQQVLDTYAIYLLNKDITTSSWPIYVFGENDIDKKRAKGAEREMIGGLAGVLGDYDSSVSFGITSTYYKEKSVNKDFNAFKKIIDDDFDILLKYIKNGHDIIVPSPNLQDLHGYYEKSYWKTINNEKKQVIFHNIGTGLACIPFEYIEYIQKKFDILKEIGDKNSDQTMNDNDKSMDDKKQDDNDKKDENDKVSDDKNKKDEQGQNAVKTDNNNNNKDDKNDKNDNNNNNNSNDKQESVSVTKMNVDGDEELARAIAASLQQQ